MEKISINKNFILGKNKFAIRNFSFAIIFIFVALFGLFGIAGKASAADCYTLNEQNQQVDSTGATGCTVVQGNGTCTVEPREGGATTSIERMSYSNCMKLDTQSTHATWLKSTVSDTNADQAAQNPKGQKSDFEKMLEGKGCASLTSFDMGACVLKFLFYGIQMPLSGILWVAAKFFDYLIYFTLSTALFKESFVVEAWGVVRDLSNIFFILILLYVAFETILGLSHNAQKTISKVIVVALLINFSMFLTGVVIDSANVLALIFYNKIEVKYIDGSGNPKDRPDTPVSNEKGISGSMAENFNLTKLVTGEMFVKAKSATNTVPGSNEKVSDGEAPTSLMIVIVLIAIVIMGVASYAFIVTGLSFLGRMIELFVLIIFSPFAFMSSTVPKLAGTEYLGWDPWFKRLINVSFMAPIFMFFLYFIFLLMKGPLIKQAGSSANSDSFISMILGMVLPTLFIVSLLLKAVEFAKKGSGKFGEMVSTGAKVVGGLALGATGIAAGTAIGATASMGTEFLGGLASKKLKEKGEDWKTQANQGGLGGYAARMKLRTMEYGSKASFDLRQAPGVGKLAGKAGINLENAKILGWGSKEGGYEGSVKRRAEKNAEEFSKVKTKMTDKEVQEWSTKKVEEYETNKKEARTKNKKYRGLSDDEFEKKYKADNGPAPVVLSSAAELNELRLKEFTASLGQTGLIASAAQSLVKNTTGFATEDNYLEDKEYRRRHAEKYGERAPINFEEDLAKEINDARLKMAKIAIGGAFAIGTGGIGGAAVGSAIGAGAVFGGVAGATSVAAVGSGKVLGDIASQNVTTEMGLKGSVKAGDEKFAKDIEKEMKTMKEITSRLERSKKEAETLEKFMGEEAQKPETERFVTGNKDSGFIVAEEKLTNAITKETIKQKGLQSRLDTLNTRLESGTITNSRERADIEASVVLIQDDMFKSVKETERLNRIKKAPERIENLKQNRDKLKDKQHSLEEANKPKDKPKSAGSAPKTPAAAKHKETHSGGGESHDAGGHDAHAAPAGGHH